MVIGKIKILGIKTKLIGAFLIPVVLIILLGTLSTEKASEVIISNYKEATKSTVWKTAEYYNLLLQMVDAKSKELAENGDVRNYYGAVYADNPAKESDIYSQINGKAAAIVKSNVNINTACILSSYGRSITTTAAIGTDQYGELIESPEGKSIVEKNGEGVWGGYHKIVDRALSLKENQYGITVGRQVISNQMKPVAIVVMDISMESIQNPLTSLMLPEGSFCAFITPDGREIAANGENTEKIFYGQEFYQTSISGSDRVGTQNIRYREEPYLYIYSKIGETGSIIATLIPEQMITAQTAEIKSLTNTMVLIAIAIAIIVGLILAAGIGSAINKMNKLVKKAAEGDLTIRAISRRKDEFGVLTKHFSGMLSGMKELIQRAAKVSFSIFDSAQYVTDSSKKMVETSRGISEVIEQMETGLEMQAIDAKQCLDKMSILEEKVEEVHAGTERITDFMDDTRRAATDGLHTVGDLEAKAKQTAGITQDVIRNIEALEEKSQKIGGIAAAINDIADETNLLSLNASIEAARAGEKGRGFGVVAEEIGKLAAASVNAAEQIDRIIKEVQNMTANTAVTARKAEKIMSSQEEVLQKTIHAFDDITNRVEGLHDSISSITNGIGDIRDAKNITMEAIQNITSVMEEIAATAEQVKASAFHQVKSSEELNQEAEHLNEQSAELQNAINKFTVE